MHQNEMLVKKISCIKGGQKSTTQIEKFFLAELMSFNYNYNFFMFAYFILFK